MNRFLLAKDAEDRAPSGCGPQARWALLLAPHVPHRVRIVARASPAGLGACSRMRTDFCASPKFQYDSQIRPVFSSFAGTLGNSFCESGSPGTTIPICSSSNKEQDLRQTVSPALNPLGIFYFEKQEYAKAIETLEAALRYDPENAGIRVNLSMVYLVAKAIREGHCDPGF